MRILVFLFATAALAQTPPSDALLSLVNEIHQLRLDLQATTVTTQRVQIALYRLQSQTALVTRANSHSEKKTVSARAQQMEDAARATQNPMERKVIEEALTQTKPVLERFSADEQRLQSRVIDAETQYRAEQTRLAELQDQLDRLDKVLDSLTRK
jgi:chromosome segregation ATPase